MSIEFEVARRHLLAANWLVARRRPHLLVVWLVVVAILAVPGFFVRGTLGWAIVSYLVFFATLVVGMTVLLSALTVASLFIYRRNDGFLCKHRIVLSPEGLTESTHLNRTLHRWATIQDILVDGSVIVFSLGWTVHVIPRSAFPDSRSVDEFLALARQHAYAITGPHGVDGRLIARVG